MFVTTFLISIVQVDDSSIAKVDSASVSDDVEINQDSEVLLADDHPDALAFQQEPLQNQHSKLILCQPCTSILEAWPLLR